MAFIWEGSGSKDDIIRYVDIKEVTDNVDFIDDNLGYIDATTSCVSHNVTYHNGHLNMHEAFHYIGNDLSQRTSNLASPYYLGNDTSHRIGHRSIHNSVDRSLPHYVTRMTTHYISLDTTPHNTTNHTSHLTVVRNPHNIGFNSTYHSKN